MVSTTKSKGKGSASTAKKSAAVKKRVSSVSKVSSGRAAAVPSRSAVKTKSKKGVVSTSTKKVLSRKSVGKTPKGSSAGGGATKRRPVGTKKVAAAPAKGISSGSRSSVKKSSVPVPRKKAAAKTPVKSAPSSASKKVKATVKKVKTTPKKVSAKTSRAAAQGTTRKSPAKKMTKPATKKLAKKPRVAIEASKVFGRSAAKLVSDLDQRGISSEVNAVTPRQSYFVVTLVDKNTEIVFLPAMPRPFKKLRDLDLVNVAERIEYALSE